MRYYRIRWTFVVKIGILLTIGILVAGCSSATKESSGTSTSVFDAIATTTTVPTMPASTIVVPIVSTTTTTTTTTTTVLSTTTTTIVQAEVLNPELIGMYGWDPEGGFYDITVSGELVLDVRCAYVDVTRDGEPVVSPQGERLRTFLHLSEPRTRYYPDTGALWVNNNGPMYAGDSVTVFGHEGWQLHWNVNNNDGTQEWGATGDSRGQCSAHISTYVASMTLEGVTDTNRPRVARLPGIGLFDHVYALGNNSEGAVDGILVIEPPCVYLELPDWEKDPSKSIRYNLILPKPYVRYDHDTETLWNGPYGPFKSGDEIQVQGGRPTRANDHNDVFTANGCVAAGHGYQSFHLWPRDSHRYAATPLSGDTLLGVYEWDPEHGFYDTVFSGQLKIVAQCVYVDVFQDGEPVLSTRGDPMRSFLRLPLLRTRFNGATGALWVNNNGPMYTGDMVTVFGTKGWQLDWNIHYDNGTQEFYDPRDPQGRCSAHESPAYTSTFVASMTIEGVSDNKRPRVAELSGLGLFEHDPALLLNFDDSTTGVLIIEPPCVYIEIPDWSENSSQSIRYNLHLPRPYVRYDPTTMLLWSGVYGPFHSGDQVVIEGGRLVSASNLLDDFIAKGCTVTGDGEHHEYRGYGMRPRNTRSR